MRQVRKIIKNALREDMPKGDISGKYLFDREVAYGKLIAKENGIISGITVIREVYRAVDRKLNYSPLVHDGDAVKVGDVIALVDGPTKSLLKAERVALNILQRMSGIATLTSRFVAETVGTKAVILDTRKTAPTLRVLEKLAVRHGGGQNHRMSLSDMVMLKDNHLKAAGSISEAVSRVRAKVNPKIKIEVEVETLAMFEEALATACDVIMLDNMDLDTMRECVRRNQGRKKLEASGNMSLDRIAEVAATGVDYISVGMLTHSYASLDISCRF